MMTNARICVVLTKKDLIENSQSFVAQVKNKFPKVDVICVNALDSKDVMLVKEMWKAGEVAIFLGSSGVGKSTIINTIVKKEVQKTGGIRDKDSKGRHTTTARQLLLDDIGRIVTDTPGVRSVQITNDNYCADELYCAIVELEKMCKYVDCTHNENQVGCAVQDALKRGFISLDVFDNYKKLKRIKKRENYFEKYEDMSDYEKKINCQNLKKNHTNRRKNEKRI